MTSVSQQIPSFIQGISDQPDELKKPGQVRDILNVSPDITNGLQKRAGLEFIANLDDGSPNGLWTEIIRDNLEGATERFICYISRSGDVYIWNADTGVQCPVFWNTGNALKVSDLPLDTKKGKFEEYDRQSDYLKHTGAVNQYLKSLTINDFTFIANPQNTVTMSANRGNKRFECFVELTTLAYNRSYDLHIDILDKNGTESYTVATEVVLTKATNLDEDASCPATNTFVASFDYSNRKREDDVKDRKASGLNVEIRTVGRQKQIGDGDSRYDYICKYNTDIRLLDGGFYWNKGDIIDYTKQLNSYQDPYYVLTVTDVQKVTVKADALVKGVTTPANADDPLSAQDILDQLKTQLKSEGFDVQILGNGLYVTYDEAFIITTPESDLFNILNQDDTDEKIIVVNDVSQLPLQCKKGLTVKVSNTFSDQDDYYLRFISTDGSRNTADGHWEEVAQPGTDVALNPDSMPIAIVKSIDTSDENEPIDSFVVTEIDWNSRTCGTEDFNPSFVGSNINHMFLFRGRMSVLSNENIIMSRAGDLFNFFPKTALTVSPVDPIDISASSKQSSVLYNSIVINNGVILFSDYNQFHFRTDSDILRPETAKCTQLASYDYDKTSKVITLGTNVGFIGSSGQYTRFYEMTNIYREGPVDISEKAKIVQRSMPDGLNIVADSKKGELVTLGRNGGKDVWGYRYFKENSQNDLQSAWFRWQLPNNLVYHFMDEENYYAVLQKNNSQITLVKSSLIPTDIDRDYFGDKYNSFVYLDYWKEYKPSDLTINNKQISVNLEIPIIDDLTLYLVTSEGDYIPESVRESDSKVTFNYRLLDGFDGEIYIGYSYKYKVGLPTMYATKRETGGVRSDTTASLTLHRMKLNVGANGYYDVNLTRFGMDNYNLSFEAPQNDGYVANGNPVIVDRELTVPIYNRNVNTDITLTSEHPTPSVLYSLRWEGDYSNNFYQRV